MLSSAPDITHDHAIETWFGIGGRADRFASPQSVDQLRACIEVDPNLRVLGEGANLLVDDAGVADLVVTLNSGEFKAIEFDERERTLRVGAGVDLRMLIPKVVRLGWAGLEGLGGIPASIGGAIVMNAGGTHGQISDRLTRVHALDREARTITLERGEIDFSYRHSGLNHLLITSAEFRFGEGDAIELRETHRRIMEAKGASQPLAAHSAGCCFKNPITPHDLAPLPPALPDGAKRGSRVPAGLLIDHAGCKGLSRGLCEVSHQHANFIVTPKPDSRKKAAARDVARLMLEVRAKVHDRFGITLEPEVVIWTRHDVGLDAIANDL
ncbi:MAG: UDP-N-acetylmuramate dehydrogenase [Phycisphaerales bacterium]